MASDRRRSSFAATLSLSLLAAPFSAQGVFREVGPVHTPRAWTVDDSGGADFLDLPPAVQAAGSGDVLLVAPGDYTRFEVLGKGLTIVGDGGVPRVIGLSKVWDLPLDEAVVLRSLAFLLVDNTGTVVLSLYGNEGTVWIEDCTIDNVAPIVFNDTPTMTCDLSDSVVLIRTTLGPRSAVWQPFSPSFNNALIVELSECHAFESSFFGPSLSNGPKLGGGAGANVNRSALYASGCLFQGGQGSPAICSSSGVCTAGGMGGPGLVLNTTFPATVTALDCTFVGGPGGRGVPCSPSSCAAGNPGTSTVGPVTTVPLPLRSLELETPVRSGTSYELQASCEPGEFVWSVFSAEVDPLYVPAYFGTQVSPLPVTLVFEGVADSTGSLTKTVPIPHLPNLVAFERLYAQGLFFDELNNAYLGSPSLLVVVN